MHLKKAEAVTVGLEKVGQTPTEKNTIITTTTAETDTSELTSFCI